LLLDEPFAALDVESAAVMRRLVREHRAALGIPMLLVTHDPIDAIVLADRAAILQAGRIVDDGPITRVLGHPRTAFIAALAGVNLVAGVAGGPSVMTTGDGLVLRGHVGPDAAPAAGGPVRAGDPASAVFSPASVHVQPEASAHPAPAPSAVENRWSGTVSTIEPAPGGVRIVTAEHPAIAVDVPTAAAVAFDLEPGARLSFAVAPADVSVRGTG
ncbi:MAG: molybdenum ABC transporter ATP-binding protein, partial [Agromyces sp.]